MTRFPAQGTRCFLYGVGRCFVDLRLEQKNDAGITFMVGQVLDSSEEESSGFKGVRVSLWNGRKAIVEKVTNDFGEFDMEYESSKDLILLVKLDGQDVVGVPLPDLQVPPLASPLKLPLRGTTVP